MKDDLIIRKEAKDVLLKSLSETLEDMWDYNLNVLRKDVNSILKDVSSKERESGASGFQSFLILFMVVVLSVGLRRIIMKTMFMAMITARIAG